MIEMKRITRLSGCDSLAILFSSTDSETIQARIEDQGWITVNNGEVYVFEGLSEGSCYHITAKTESEELRLAFSTQYKIPKPTPYTYYHASNTNRKGVMLDECSIPSTLYPARATSMGVES